MDTQAFVLGHILRRFPEFEFSMDEFDDRLRLQKFIYLLQAHGIYLGYDYSWYLRGPYCTALATAGFMLKDFYDMLPEKRDKYEGFTNSVVQDRFEKFVKFIGKREADTNFLEVAASLHYQLSAGRAATHEIAVDNVLKKMERGYDYDKTPQEDRADKEYVEHVLREMVDNGLIHSAGQVVGDGVNQTSPDFAVSTPTEPAMPAAMPRDMGPRHSDKALYYTLADAARDSDMKLVGKNVFRPGEDRPVVDDYVMNDDAVFGIRRKHGIGIPTN